MKFFNLLDTNFDLRQKAQIFYSNNCKPEEILEAGRYCAILLYRASKDVSVNQMKNIDDLQAFLEQMQNESFIKGTTKSSAVKLSSLFPTIDALNEHSRRILLPNQIWLGNKNINPTGMGCYRKIFATHQN